MDTEEEKSSVVEWRTGDLGHTEDGYLQRK